MPRLISLFILLFLFSVALIDAQEQKSPVKMGLILPLTGTAQSWGKHMSNAAELALSELEPSIRNRLQLVFEDDQLHAGKAVLAFKKLTSIDNIDVGVLKNSVVCLECMALLHKMTSP